MRLGMGLCGLVLVGAVAGQARAYPFETTTPPPGSEPKSPGKALAWSAGLTVLGSAALIGGLATDQEAAGVFIGTPLLVFGPAIGRGYAGGPVFPGLLIRGVSGAVAVFVLKENLLQCTDECGPGEDALYLEGDAKIVFYSAAAVMFASAVYDSVRAPLEARDFNRAHGFAVAPTAVPGGAGVAVGGSF
jgi:hypothetical protein